MKRMNAFTLAEVLITLGIIGVVAAMTMPTLINQTNGAQYKAAYKKALSAIAQAVTLNVALDDVGFGDVLAGTAGKTDAPTGGASIASLLNTRMNVVKASGSANSGYGETDGATDFPAQLNAYDADGNATESISPDTFLFFNDGSMFAFKGTAASCLETSDATKCYGAIDVNGTKGPNKVVTCDQGDEATEDNCTVKSPTDIYPVVFYDQTILPASPAAKAVLYGK